MSTYDLDLRRAERFLLAASVGVSLATSVFAMPWLQSIGVPPWVAGMLTGVLSPGIVFFGGRHLFQTRLWPSLRSGRPLRISGHYELVARMVRSGCFVPESSGTARISQRGLTMSLDASTTRCSRVLSTSMTYTGSGRGVLLYSAVLRLGGRSDVHGLGEFHLVYPEGDATQVPIGVFFTCREFRPGAADRGDDIEVVYFKTGYKKSVLDQLGWNSKARKAG